MKKITLTIILITISLAVVFSVNFYESKKNNEDNVFTRINEVYEKEVNSFKDAGYTEEESEKLAEWITSPHLENTKEISAEEILNGK